MNAMSERVYVRHSIVDCEEDVFHEFKGHRSICMEDGVNPFHQTRYGGRTRQPWSKYICGLLNSMVGGTLYGGIFDNGMVAGMTLTPYQKEHVVLSIDDTLARYSPPVSKQRYNVSFIPVVEKVGEAFVPDPVKVRPEVRRRPHKLRYYGHCWCDMDCAASYGMGVLVPHYVIELEVGASRGGGEQVMHMAEDGHFYLRKHATTELYNRGELEEMVRQWR